MGLRVPIFQLVDNSQVNDNEFGDIDLLFKYALINDRETGNVLSTGMVITLPTAKNVQITGESSLNSTLFQPFVGFILNSGDFYTLGFSSIAVPTDFRDVTLLFNSIGAGYWAYRNNAQGAMITGIIPTTELHITTPLNHRGNGLNGSRPHQLLRRCRRHSRCAYCSAGRTSASPSTPR